MAFWEGNRAVVGKSGTAEVEVIDRPRLKSAKPIASQAHATNDAIMSEYAELAKLIGVAPPDLTIEKFKSFLAKNDIPTFSLAEVISYMDDRAAKESKDKCGWEWRPLREKDDLENAQFGREASRTYENSRSIITIPASDWYRGPYMQRQNNQNGAWSFATAMPIPAQFMPQPAQPATHYRVPGRAKPYDRTVPIHALRKAALIEGTFGKDVSLFVSDYALAPQIQYPDPFLMAVVNNPNLANGTGRFIIDFWDEPGFGLDRMLKS